LQPLCTNSFFPVTVAQQLYNGKGGLWGSFAEHSISAAVEALSSGRNYKVHRQRQQVSTAGALWRSKKRVQGQEGLACMVPAGC
jgi:hypothetical protein